MSGKIEKLAEELYDWSGRYGAHGGVLWKDARGNKQQEYIVEAKFILREFIEKVFGYRLISELREEIKKVERQYPDYVCESNHCIFDDGFEQCCDEKILKKMEEK